MASSSSFVERSDAEQPTEVSPYPISLVKIDEQTISETERTPQG